MYPHVPSMTAQQLAEALQGDRPPLLLDVREYGEVAAESVPNALHIPMGSLQLRVGEIPAGQPVAVICHSGGRSAYAAAFLISEGYEAVNIEGGIVALRGVNL